MNTLRSLLTRLPGRSYRDPAHDWFMVLVSALIILAGVMVWAAWTYDTVSRGGSIGAPLSAPPAVFDNSSLTTIRAVFESRASEEAKYVTGVYRFTDPSQ